MLFSNFFFNNNWEDLYIKLNEVQQFLQILRKFLQILLLTENPIFSLCMFFNKNNSNWGQNKNKLINKQIQFQFTSIKKNISSLNGSQKFYSTNQNRTFRTF